MTAGRSSPAGTRRWVFDVDGDDFLGIVKRSRRGLELPRSTWCLEGQRPLFGYESESR